MCTLIKCIYHFAKLHVILYNHADKNTWGTKIPKADIIARANLSGGTDFKGDKFACDTGRPT